MKFYFEEFLSNKIKNLDKKNVVLFNCIVTAFIIFEKGSLKLSSTEVLSIHEGNPNKNKIEWFSNKCCKIEIITKGENQQIFFMIPDYFLSFGIFCEEYIYQIKKDEYHKKLNDTFRLVILKEKNYF